MTRSSLHRACAEHLRALIDTPVRATGDWAITYPLSCTCDLCKELARFLQSSQQNHDWPLAKDRRQHIHGMISAARLPVLHTTLRQGSPHILQLRKEPSLFSREAEYRAKLKAILGDLPPLGSP